MLKVRFEFNKMISYWNKNEGAGVKVDGTMNMRTWSTDASWLNKTVTINSIEEVQRKLEKILESQYMPSDYFTIMDDGRVSFNVLEDGEANVLDGEQADELHDDGEQVYLCDYDVFIEIQETYEPTVEQLKQMFPKADY